MTVFGRSYTVDPISFLTFSFSCHWSNGDKKIILHTVLTKTNTFWEQDFEH